MPGGLRGQVEAMQLTVIASAWDLPASRIAPGGAIVEPLGEGSCRLTLGAWSWVGLAALFGTFDAHMSLCTPPELRDAATLLAQRYAAAADQIEPHHSRSSARP